MDMQITSYPALVAVTHLNESAKVLHQLFLTLHNVRAGLLERHQLLTSVQVTLLEIRPSVGAGQEEEEKIIMEEPL